MLLHIPNKVGQVTWSSPVTNRLLVEAGVSYILEDQQFNPRPESVAPQITDTGKNVTYRATLVEPARLHAGLRLARLGVVRHRQPRVQGAATR